MVTLALISNKAYTTQHTVWIKQFLAYVNNGGRCYQKQQRTLTQEPVPLIVLTDFI